MRYRRILAVGGVLALVGILVTAVPRADAETRLEKIERTGVLTAGTRTASIPFAYIDKDNVWKGFAVDLLEKLRARLEAKLGKPIKLDKKEVNPKTRIAMVANNTVDLECGSTTFNRRRDETVDFTSNFFFTGSQLLVKKGSKIKDTDDLVGKRTGATQGTTNEKALRRVQPKAIIVPFQDHAAGFLALEQGKIETYVTDGILLAGLAAKSKTPDAYQVVGPLFSADPYSCIVPENDSNWRDFVNHTIWELVDSGEFFTMYEKWFGPKGVVPYPMSYEVREYLQMQAMPE